MVTFTLMVCTEPYKFEGIDSMIEIGKALLRKGHLIKGVFFYGSGVYNLKSGIETGSDTRNIPEKLAEFCNGNDIPMIGCTTWVGLAGLKEPDFIGGSGEDGLGALSNWTWESDKLLVFGTGS